jgi:hypothetical protein
MEKRPIKSAQPNLAQLPLLNPSSSLPTTPYPLIPLSPARLLPSVPCPPPLSCPLPCLLLLLLRPPLSPPPPSPSPSPTSSATRLCLLRRPPLPPPHRRLSARLCPPVARGSVPGWLRFRQHGFNFGGAASISTTQLRSQAVRGRSPVARLRFRWPRRRLVRQRRRPEMSTAWTPRRRLKDALKTMAPGRQIKGSCAEEQEQGHRRLVFEVVEGRARRWRAQVAPRPAGRGTRPPARRHSFSPSTADARWANAAAAGPPPSSLFPCAPLLQLFQRRDAISSSLLPRRHLSSSMMARSNNRWTRWGPSEGVAHALECALFGACGMRMGHPVHRSARRCGVKTPKAYWSTASHSPPCTSATSLRPMWSLRFAAGPSYSA